MNPPTGLARRAQPLDDATKHCVGMWNASKVDTVQAAHGRWYT